MPAGAKSACSIARLSLLPPCRHRRGLSSGDLVSADKRKKRAKLFRDAMVAHLDELTKKLAHSQNKVLANQPKEIPTTFGISKANPKLGRRVLDLLCAAEKTRRLLYGGAVGSILEGRIRPNLDRLKHDLLRLTTQTKVNCVELAQIIASTHEISVLPRLKPSKARDAALWLACTRDKWQVKLGSEKPILEALEQGDIPFFKRLCKHLQKPLPKDKDKEWKWTVRRCWTPDRSWPGLAFCTPAARIQFLRLALGDKACPSKKDLENFVRLRRFVRGKTPLIRHIQEQGEVHMLT